MQRIAAELRAIADGRRPDPAREPVPDTGGRRADRPGPFELPKAARGRSIPALLAQAQRMTGMDVALLGEIRDGREVVAATAGDARSFGLSPGVSVGLEETYCHLLLQGRLPNIVSDARSHELVRDLALTRTARVGAYIGVPLTTREAQLFVLCCLAHERRPDLNGVHVDALRRLAQSIGRQLSSALRPAPR